jgi:hypothetical protein
MQSVNYSYNKHDFNFAYCSLACRFKALFWKMDVFLSSDVKHEMFPLGFTH